MVHERTARLMKMSRFMRWLCLVLIAIVLVASAIIASHWFFSRAGLTEVYPGVPFSPDTVSTTTRLMIIAINAVTVAFTCLGLSALSKLFAGFQRNEALTARSSYLLRSAGVSFLVVALYGVLARTLTVLLLTINNPPGQKQLAIGFGTNELFAILLAGTLFAVGHVLFIASEIDEENKGFI